MNFVPQTDFTGAGFTYDSTYTNFGLTVYKQYESLFGYDVRVSDHIQYLTEMGAGAHYSPKVRKLLRLLRPKFL